jgi:hypothetical protein
LRLVRQHSAVLDDFFEANRQKPISGVAALVPASAADVERIVLQDFQDAERKRAAAHSQTNSEDIEEILDILNEEEALWSDGFKQSN